MSNYRIGGWQPRAGVKHKGDLRDQTGSQRGPGWRRKHRTRREYDEIVCSCGKRWPVGQSHP